MLQDFSKNYNRSPGYRDQNPLEELASSEATSDSSNLIPEEYPPLPELSSPGTALKRGEGRQQLWKRVEHPSI